MKHSFLDHYSDRDSIIHRLDARAKLGAALAFIAVVVLTPRGIWPAFGAYLAVIAVIIALSRLPIGYIIKRSLVIVPFVLVVAAFVPFFGEGEIAASLNIWQWHISMTDSGLRLLASIAARAWLSVLSLILLVSTTSFAAILEAIERFKMPRVMVLMMSFMYRYIFLLTDEVMRMKRARDSRSFGGGQRLWRIKSVGSMIGTLFLRSYERGERVYASMLARGYEGYTQQVR